MRSLDSFGYAIHDRDARDAKRARASRRRASRVGYPERRRLRATARRPGARAGVRDGVWRGARARIPVGALRWRRARCDFVHFWIFDFASVRPRYAAVDDEE